METTALGAKPEQYKKKSHVFIFEDQNEWQTFLNQTPQPPWAASFAHGDELFLSLRNTEPGAPAFVKVGDTVRQGQTLLIIEAMKVMNQIKAPKGGKLTRILIADSSPVEFGQAVMIVE